MKNLFNETDMPHPDVNILSYSKIFTICRFVLISVVLYLIFGYLLILPISFFFGITALFIGLIISSILFIGVISLIIFKNRVKYLYAVLDFWDEIRSSVIWYFLLVLFLHLLGTLIALLIIHYKREARKKELKERISDSDPNYDPADMENVGPDFKRWLKERRDTETASGEQHLDKSE